MSLYEELRAEEKRLSDLAWERDLTAEEASALTKVREHLSVEVRLILLKQRIRLSDYPINTKHRG